MLVNYYLDLILIITSALVVLSVLYYQYKKKNGPKMLRNWKVGDKLKHYTDNSENPVYYIVKEKLKDGYLIHPQESGIAIQVHFSEISQFEVV